VDSHGRCDAKIFTKFVKNRIEEGTVHDRCINGNAILREGWGKGGTGGTEAVAHSRWREGRGVDLDAL
jgi:hypothetical protein